MSTPDPDSLSRKGSAKLLGVQSWNQHQRDHKIVQFSSRTDLVCQAIFANGYSDMTRRYIIAGMYCDVARGAQMCTVVLTEEDSSVLAHQAKRHPDLM